ncbi:MAG: cadherin-like domain-containing protein [Planctomycetaceae bacterium]|nr:cadherin-like domain-containing protein [Planctomycetaceae bacterium]
MKTGLSFSCWMKSILRGCRKRNRSQGRGHRAERFEDRTLLTGVANVTATLDDQTTGPVRLGDQIDYSLTIENTGDADATDIMLMLGLDPDTTEIPDSLQITPIAFDDTYALMGNAPLTVSAMNGVLANDIDIDATPMFSNVGLTAKVVDDVTNGTLSLNSDGSFTYTPNTGFTGSDSFTYTATDADNLDSVITGTVTLTISGLTWFVDNSATGGGDGSYSNPFNSLAALNGAGGAGDVDSVGDTIFLFEGAGAYGSNIALENNQKLIGEGVGYSINNLTIAAGNDPVITDAANTGVILASNNEVAGLSVLSSSRGIEGTGNLGTTSIHDVTLSGNVNEEILFTNVSGTVTVADSTIICVAIPAIGITGGDADIDFLNTSIQHTNQQAILINGRTGGSVEFIGGSIDQTNGNALQLTSSAGTYRFDNITYTGSGTGINLASNPLAVTAFNDLSINGSGSGIFLSNAGTVTFATIDGTNTVNIAGGHALNAEGGTKIGPAGWNFSSLSATNATFAGGVRLDNVSGSGGLTVGTTTLADIQGTSLLVQNSNIGSNTFDFGNVTISDTAIGSGAMTGGIDISTGNDAATKFTFDSLNVTTDGGIGLKTGANMVNIGGTSNTITANGNVAISSRDTNTNAGWTFSTVNSSKSATYGIDLYNVSGDVTINAGEITNTVGWSVLLTLAKGNFTFGGNISTPGNAGFGVQSFLGGGTTANTAVFSGTIGGRVSLTDNDQNAGMTITFSGTLNISSLTNDGFTATKGGTVNVTGSKHTVATTSGTAVTIADTTIGAGGVTFQSISANGAASGIVLANTGAGKFTVTGDGTLANNDSGGVIQNTTSHGISLTNANNVTLQSIRIDTISTSSTQGINSVGGANIVLSAVTIQNLNGTDSNAWLARDLMGVNRIDNGSLFTKFDPDAGGGLDLANKSANMTSFTIDSSTFSGQNENNGKTVVFVEAQGSSNMGTVSVTNSLFTGLTGNAVVTSATDIASLTSVIESNTFRDAVTGGIGGAGGVFTTSSSSATHVVTISKNQFDDLFTYVSHIGAISVTILDSSTLAATISQNKFLDLDSDGDVLPNTDAIYIASGQSSPGAGPVDITIDGNTIDDVGSSAIFLAARSESPDFDVRIRDNLIGQTSAVGFNNQDAVSVEADDFAQVDLLMTGNLIRADLSTQEVLQVRTGSFGFGSRVNATIGGAGALGNTFNNINGSGLDNIVIDARAFGGTICLNMDNNTLLGVTTIDLDNGGGTFDVTQASSVALSGANNGATVNVVGTVTFNQPVCPLPTFSAPTLIAPAPPIFQVTPELSTIPVKDVSVDDPLLSQVDPKAMNPVPTPSTPKTPPVIRSVAATNSGEIAEITSPLDLGTLPAGKAIRLLFSATVNAASNGLVPAISVQGTVSYNDGFNPQMTVTDDPGTKAADDATVTEFDSLSLGNQIWIDTNGNSTFDDGIDATPNDVTVRLYVDDGDGILDAGDGSPLATTKTANISGKDGRYEFTGLLPGDYLVEVVTSTGPLSGLISVSGSADPDDDVDNDDNGIAVAGFEVASSAITLSYDGEPGMSNTNDTLDFGFVAPALTITFDKMAFPEDGTATGTVTRNGDTDAPLVVTLTSGDPGSATVPMSVTILAGESSADFAITGVTDAIADGTQTVTITGTAMGFSDGKGDIDVTDIDIATITLTIDLDSIGENGGSATGTLTHNSPTDNPILVSLTSSDIWEARVPASIEIPAGKNTITFSITGFDEQFVDGDALVTITATVPGHVDGTDTLTITDDDVSGASDDLLFFDESSLRFKFGTNTGTTFSWFQTNPLPSTASGYDSFIGDFDGDGDFDGAVRNRDTKNINLFRNNGDGTLSGPIASGRAGTAGTSAHFQVGDYDGNGRDQILWLYTDGQFAGAIFSRDLVSGTAYLYTANPSYDSFVTGDFNGDGFDDLVGLYDNEAGTRTNIIPFYSIASTNPLLPRRLSAIPQGRSGGPTLGTFGLSIVNDGLGGFQAADLNGDGKDDLIAVTSGGGTPGQVLLATTTGNPAGDSMVFPGVQRFVTSNRAPQFDPMAYPGPILLGQLNHDLLADLFSADTTGSQDVAAGVLNPAFLNPMDYGILPASYGTGSPGLDYAIGDFNGDGYDDIVGLNGQASVFLSTGRGMSFGSALDFGSIIGGGAGQIGAIATE